MATRQVFQGSDDLLLLSCVAQAPPWRQRGVMEAWQQIAEALNADAACSLTTLSAAATRARFFRMVAQRRAGQDKQLRRGTSDERQCQRKLTALDALIARMDMDDGEMSLHQLLRGVDDDVDPGHVMLPLPVSNPRAVAPQPAPQPTTIWPQYQRPSAQHQPVLGRGTVVHKPTPKPAQAKAAASRTVVALDRQVQKPPAALPQRSPPAMAVTIPIDSPGIDHRRAASPRPSDAAPPAKRQATGDKASAVACHTTRTNGGGEGWEGLACRALEFMQRKLELDREAAEADRAWRREEARARQDEVKSMREQTDRLIHAVLELVKAKS